ncbi:MAG: glycosyltransferase family 2 protein [Elioraea sp.]|nr:glycosyltransferase family 2 protein [Elioraea sp.]
MAEPRFSLIVATVGRTAELGSLLESVLAQKRNDVEAIVVDQNPDGRLDPVLAPFRDRIALAHLRSPRPHANAARNLGLAHARGDLVAFPDDDCLHPPGVLDRVDRAFRDDPDLAILTGPAASPSGGLGSGRWREEGGTIDLRSVWTSVIEFNLWLRREVALALGGFDERLGPGTQFGSAEGNDLVARAIRAGHRAVYDPGLRIIHPDKRGTEIAASRARIYGAGLGRVLRRHAPLSSILTFLLRPAGGMVRGLLRRDAREARYFAATLRGRLEGLLARERP